MSEEITKIVANFSKSREDDQARAAIGFENIDKSKKDANVAQTIGADMGSMSIINEGVKLAMALTGGVVDSLKGMLRAFTAMALKKEMPDENTANNKSTPTIGKRA